MLSIIKETRLFIKYNPYILRTESIIEIGIRNISKHTKETGLLKKQVNISVVCHSQSLDSLYDIR